MVKKGSEDIPEISIGLVGHVDHGKTTLNERLSGKWTDTHSEEQKRGITIKLGYSDATIFKFKDGHFATKRKDPATGEEGTFVRKVSFVDVPGHESLMATMMSGAKIMDGAILLVAANETCPQPQTREHLAALEISGIKNVVVVQNKIDIITKEKAVENYNQIKKFLSTSSYKDVPIIPLSALHGVNVDVLLQAIEEEIPTPKRDDTAAPLMIIARSFDVNKPGTTIEALQGGVLGGALIQGSLSKGDKIEISPGIVKEKNNQLVAEPIITTITKVITGSFETKQAFPGGTISLMTELDPSLTNADSLVGNLVGHPGKLPPVWTELALKAELFEQVVGSSEEVKVGTIASGEVLLMTCNAAKTAGVVRDTRKGIISCKLKIPICASIGDKVSLSRRVGNRFRLIGYGVIVEKK
ncbi:MAG: translation initiation factor IF-2 subunit gamma [Candidatus Woesearchaeota archaeon]|nr:MAG: translation initiation factor IF-2 subunit gamma [Candidatus Woesearchaeota archaeon]